MKSVEERTVDAIVAADDSNRRHMINGMQKTQVVDETGAVATPLTDAEIRATPLPVSGPLTDTELRASAVAVDGPLTDTELRATAVPVSGPLTDTQLRATAVPVSGPLTDTQLRATPVPVSGPLTDTELRASKVPVIAQLYDEAGVAYGVKHIGNKVRVSSMPYLFDIAEGNVANHAEFEQFGFNADIDITAEDVWNVGGTYVFPAAEQQMELVSSSVEDDPDTGGGTPGTGIHTVTIYYLDDEFTEKTEDVNLNGTAVVTTLATDIYRINSIRAKTVGTGGAAAGNIDIRNLADTPIYSRIETGQTRSRNLIYTVPKNKTLYITSLFGGCTSTAANGATITFRAKYDHLAAAARTFFMPHAEILVGSNGGGIYRPLELPIKIPQGIDIKCSATTLANNGTVSASLRGWIES